MLGNDFWMMNVLRDTGLSKFKKSDTQTYCLQVFSKGNGAKYRNLPRHPN